MTPDLIADQIARAIREGEFGQGAQLVQEDLARRFGVSRNPIREALRLLEANGLVEIRGGGGATVRTLSSDDLVELYGLRKVLEPTIAVALVDSSTQRAIAELDAMATAMADEPRIPQWMELNYAFHQRLYVLSGLPRTASILTSLLSAVQPYSRRNIEDLGGKEQADVEHRSIVDALRAHDSDRLAALLVQHLEGAERRLRPAPSESTAV